MYIYVAVFSVTNVCGQSLVSVWRACSPYLGQLLAILKHSDVNLRIVGSVYGEQLVKNIEEVCLIFVHLLCSSSAWNLWILQMMAKRVDVDVRAVYRALRDYVMSRDENCERGGLKRCYMPSGRTLWLCKEHQRLPRVTVLDDPIVSNENDSGV